jgi:uncharacterized protein YdeI (YjbR/CyaY-like superfamily)
MEIKKTFTARNGAEWRAWLAANYAKEQEIWLVYFKAASGQTGIDYETSVEEALCYGWVDSLIQKIDEATYARKFNPRRKSSVWSASNKRRVEKLIAEERMTPFGLEKYDPNARESTNETALKVMQSEIPIHADILQVLKTNRQAWENFQKLAPAQQRRHIGWVVSGRKVETQQKRLAEIINLLEKGQKLGLK